MIAAGKTFKKMVVDEKVWTIKQSPYMGRYVYYRSSLFAPRKTGVATSVAIQNKETGEELVAVSVGAFNMWVKAGLVAVY